MVTANLEVQTNEAAQVFVHDLGLFVTVQLLEDTPAVLSLGKLCEEHGYSYEWVSGQKPHLITNAIRIQCNTENFVPIVVPGLSASFFLCKYHTSNDMFPRRKTVHRMATGKSDDELLQHDNNFRIWKRSGKFRKVENPELCMLA